MHAFFQPIKKGQTKVMEDFQADPFLLFSSDHTDHNFILCTPEKNDVYIQ
jgi:hypothetical protein